MPGTRCRLSVSLLFISTLLAQPRPGPTNLDFKDPLPAGWFAPVAKRGFPADTTDQCSKPGVHCGVLRAEPGATGPFGNLMQYFDAARYQNKRVRFRASVRVESKEDARAQLWLRVDRPNEKIGFFDNMGDRPITSPEWRTYEINGEVNGDARGIAIGMMLFGSAGAAYIDAVSFEVTGDAATTLAPVTERARPLAGRGLANLTAYARLYGYIRHFHPSDEVFRADWEAIAVAGVPVVEGAANPVELARKLEDYFRPVAPSVRVFPASDKAPTLDLGTGAKMIWWQHFGFGTGNSQSLYHSDRKIGPAPGGKLPEPFLADLGGGVKALVPTALYWDDDGTHPRGTSPAPKPDVSIRYSVEDRATRLADVVIAWNILQHFYPYFDVVHTDWPQALTAALESAATDRDEAVFLLTLRLMVAALKDGHGYVSFTDRRVSAPLHWDWVENRLVVTQVGDVKGQAIAPGDTVLSIDGKRTAQALAAAEEFISGATPQWIRYRALSDLSAGPPNKPLVLEIEPFDAPGTRRTVTLPRDGSRPAVTEPRPEKISELKPGIWYVDLTRIDDSEWKAALPKLEKATGIVFDLRGYPGKLGPGWMTHLHDTGMDSAQWHVPVVTQPDHRDMKFDRRPGWNLSPAKPYLAAKRAVLTDGSAISYAESTMGIVEHYKLAAIVGSTTAGTNGNVNPFKLPGGYTIRWTGMKVLKHDGSQHHGVGIAPTIPVERTRAGVAAGRDEVLERGIQAVQ